MDGMIYRSVHLFAALEEKHNNYCCKEKMYSEWLRYLYPILGSIAQWKDVSFCKLLNFSEPWLLDM